MLNHIEDPEIPATNNTIENYYRTTLPRSQKKNIQNKRRITKKNKRTTNTMDTQSNTKTTHSTQQKHNIQLKITTKK